MNIWESQLIECKIIIAIALTYLAFAAYIKSVPVS